MSDLISIRSSTKEYRVLFGKSYTEVVKTLSANNVFFLVDRQIHTLYFSNSSILPPDRTFIIEANEFNKTPEFVLDIIGNLVDKGVKKSASLVAIGGGIVQDITSFTASILFRGLSWIFIPTTLVAQADSCIGGKSSINFRKVKNLLGTFNPPDQIYIDTEFLNSLPEDDIKSGIGEILHYYIYSNSKFIDKIQHEYASLFTDRTLLTEHIRESLSIKKEMVEIDEFDRGPRRKFNYGHTFGHALETLTEYQINHGQAVTIGMDLANFLSLQLGFISEQQYKEMEIVLMANFPRFSIEQFDIQKYLGLLSKDKKNTNQNLTCILCKGKGNLIIHELEMNATLKTLIENYFHKKLPKK